MIKSLTEPAQKIIQDYLHLPLGGQDVPCPYYNNRHAGVRAGLRALIGKGNIRDIIEEAGIVALREKVDLKKLDRENLTKFLVDNNIGIDCSGFAYHILDAELKARGLGPIRQYIKFPYIKNPLRKILTLFRPAEHTGARTIAHEINTKNIELKNICPGDMIIMLETGVKNNFNHLLLVASVEYENDLPKKINYVHSFAWRADGQYGHGVREGKIEITDQSVEILKQNWMENGKTNEENETWQHAKMARILNIKRLIRML